MRRDDDVAVDGKDACMGRSTTRYDVDNSAVS